MKSVCVIIPMYKESLEENELKSLDQCLKTLKNHKIIFISPKGLIINNKYKFIENVCFDNFYFKNIPGYNKLMLSKKFYKKFIKYDFMLIYQLDAWVFKDELSKWVSKGYDYIGAPWINENEILVGNGGFSLRNIQAQIETLNKFKILESRKNILKAGLSQDKKNWFKLIGYKNNSKFLIKNFSQNEDYFWSHYAPQINLNYKVAPSSEAIKFAFEKKPEILYKKNKNQLPFGCHAWEKYEPEFWQKHINIDYDF